MIVVLCPKCLRESIGPMVDVILCSHCRTAHAVLALEKMVQFYDKPWVREATEKEKERFQLLAKAHAAERMARRYRLLAENQ